MTESSRFPGKPADSVVSPCIRECCLDDLNICLGCFRHLDEITAWAAADSAQREAILQRCQQRREASHKPAG